MITEMHNCKKCQREFQIEPDDFSFYEKMDVLPPKLCPECRAQLRLAFRNERAFYKRDCDKCGKGVVSMYSPNKPYTVWCYDCWFADDWDARDYGRDYDPSRPFLEQFSELANAVPKIGLVYVRSPGSEYTNISADNKNCYMIVESSNNEDCIHSYWLQECRDSVDTSYTSKSERMYECDDCYNSYQLSWSKGCHDCRDSAFIFDCKGCFDCLGCVNLRQKQYCIFNEQYSKEEYEAKRAAFSLDTHSGVEAFSEEFSDFLKKQPRKYAEILNVTNSTGNYMKHVKNCRACFHTYEAEDSAYGEHVWRNAKDCMDVSTAGRNASMIYNSINSGLDVASHICSVQGWSSTFIQYSMYTMNANHCFGCAGIRKQDYCILNTQYEKDAYEALMAEIVSGLKASGEYGAFFPAELSSFGYNETPAAEQFPLTKEEALAQGFKWEDMPRGIYGKATIGWEDVPDAIGGTSEDIIKEIFECEHCQKNYRIIGNEFSFYHKLNIPLPRWCPECRHARRIAARGPNKLWNRSCMCKQAGHDHSGRCPNEFETSYAPERPEILYCESCYQKEVV